MAPFDDPSFEIWGLNDLYEVIPRWDRWFELHDRVWLEKYHTRVKGLNHVSQLKTMTCPVYMQQVHADIPGSVEYPLDKMINKYGGYFTNSVPYMLALAIEEGFEEIHIYGVDLSFGTEYGYAQACMAYWIGLARGMGIKVILPDNNVIIGSSWLYAYDEPVGENEVVIRFMMATRKIKLINSVVGADFSFQAGREVHAAEIIAEDLIRGGHAVPVDETKASEPKNLEIETAAIETPEKAVMGAPKRKRVK